MIAIRDDALTDEALFERYQSGDHQAFEQLAKAYSGNLLGYLYKIVENRAEDCLQETFTRIHEKQAQFDARRGRFKNWAYGIAHNVAVDVMKKAGAKKRGSASSLDERFINIKASEPKSRGLGITQKYVDALPPKYRTIINLIYERGMTLNRTSAALQIPLGTVKSRLNAALEILRAEMRDPDYLEAA